MVIESGKTRGPRSTSMWWAAALLASALSAIVTPAAPAGAWATPTIGTRRVAEAIGDRIVRFFESPEARAAAPPSVALERPFPALGPALADFDVSPAFDRVQGLPRVTIAIARGTSLYGTGEAAGPLRRNGRRTVCWNFDAYGYDDRTPHLYQSHPWVLAVRADGSAFGVLFDTTARGVIDLARGIQFTGSGPPFAVIVIERDSPQEVVRALADLTGHMELPPRWALGYHQCRYSYFPDSRVRAVAGGFRERGIPCDAIWMDIDYMDGFRCFTFSPSGFPDPARLCEDLHGIGFRSVWIVDPGIKAEPGYGVFDSGTARDVWVERSDGAPYRGRVWPGACVFPDFTMRAARAWWGDQHHAFLARGMDGEWNDMNEPAIFGVDSKTMPLDNRHRADAELGGPGSHARYHNIYGMQMVRATREALLAERPARRPFVLTRANYIGGQRYAATWTGDNLADWSHLEDAIPMILNLGLSGQPFAGPDIGGFGGNGTPGLFARWMGFGALLPFARGHTGKGNISKEPWAFGPEVERICRLALQRRYRLLPYLYSVFREASVTGLPVARPVFFADPADPRLRDVDDAFLLGGDVLVRAHVQPDGVFERSGMPRGDWQRFDCGIGDTGERDLPDLYLRGGAILPLGPVIQHVDEKPLDPLELVIALDAEGHAEGSLYEDEGDGFGYREGRFRLSRYVAERRGDRVSVTVEGRSGALPAPARKVVARVLLAGRQARGEADEGTPLEVQLGGR